MLVVADEADKTGDNGKEGEDDNNEDVLVSLAADEELPLVLPATKRRTKKRLTLDEELVLEPEEGDEDGDMRKNRFWARRKEMFTESARGVVRELQWKSFMLLRGMHLQQMSAR